MQTYTLPHTITLADQISDLANEVEVRAITATSRAISLAYYELSAAIRALPFEDVANDLAIMSQPRMLQYINANLFTTEGDQ